MTKQHPITPPPELVKQWVAEIWHEGAPVQVAADHLYIATQAARWGADIQLELCEKYWMTHGISPQGVVDMRHALRPKPPSLKEQALMALEDGDIGPGASLTPGEVCIIRRALEQLDD